MANAQTPRQAWIDAGLDALASGGPDAVRVESLARTLKVTKGGFYGYFADRGALLADMLDSWERRSVDDAIERADRSEGDAVSRVSRAAQATFSPELRAVDLAVREWARRDSAVAERLARVDGQRMAYLRSNLEATFTDPTDLEARCLLAFCAAIATDLIAADHPGQTREEVLDHATRLILTRSGPGVLEDGAH